MLPQDIEAAPPRQAVPEKKIRQDIQLIRALAVIFVYLYHLELPFLRGGFIGVDIFLVVSGYLVVGSMLERQRQGNFDVAQFVIQRIKRLTIPSFVGLIAIIMLLKIVASHYLFLFPVGGFKEAGMASLHMANLHFLWSSAEYFQPDSAKSFVLHYWSLGLEEQFYVVICILAVAFSKLLSCYQKKPTATAQFLFIALLWVISFIIFWSVEGSSRFYTVQSRTWEFLTGALIHLLEPWFSGLTVVQKLPTILNGFISFVVVVGLCLFGANPSLEPYPNITTILVAGLTTILLIKPFSPEPRILFAPLLYIGDWSYSIYLFHWPIIKFLMIASEITVLFDYLAVTAITLVVSCFSYYFVEKRSQLLQFTWKQWIVVFIVGSTLIAGTAYYEQREVNCLRLQAQYDVLEHDHQAMLLNATKAAAVAAVKKERVARPGAAPVSKEELKKNLDALEPGLGWPVKPGANFELQLGLNRCILASGDSKMRQWNVATRFLANMNNATFYDTTVPGQPARLGGVQAELQACKKVLALVSRDTTRWGAAYGLASPGPQFRALEARDAAHAIAQWPGYCVIMFSDTPFMNRSSTLPRNCLSDHAAKDGPIEPCHSWTNQSMSPYDTLLRGSLIPPTSLISMSDLFCDDVYCYANHGNNPLYIENHHISSYAATLFTDEFLERVKASPCYNEWAN